MRHGWGGAVHPERCRAFQYRETLSGCKRSARPAHSVTVVWRAEGSVAVGEQVAGPAATVTPGDLDLSEPGVRVTHVAESERDRLRRQSARLGGRSTLLHFDESVDAGIEITKAHPGSLPQFITGRSTLLSNLFRDEVALRTARMAAEQITAKNVELRTARGIEAVHLAVGLAVWRLGGLECSAPVLLRPLAIRRHHSDFELKLHGSFSVNPELVRALRTHFGIDLDGDALAALAYDQGVFKPQPVIDHLRALTSGFDHFRVHPRLVVSSFADVGETMTRDCRDLDHPVLNALAGHLADREAFTARRDVPQMPHPDERPPAADTLLLDADAEQEAVLARILAGQSLAVHTLPGTGGTQTVINTVGALVRDGKRVLVVSARRSTLDGIRHRLAGIGLPGLAVSPRSLRRDLIRAIGRNEKAQAPKVADIDDALVRAEQPDRERRVALVRQGVVGEDAVGVDGRDRAAAEEAIRLSIGIARRLRATGAEQSADGRVSGPRGRRQRARRSQRLGGEAGGHGAVEVRAQHPGCGVAEHGGGCGFDEGLDGLGGEVRGVGQEQGRILFLEQIPGVLPRALHHHLDTVVPQHLGQRAGSAGAC